MTDYYAVGKCPWKKAGMLEKIFSKNLGWSNQLLFLEFD